MAESTLANWKLGVGGGSIASSVLTLSDTLDTLALYLDMEAPSTPRRAVYVPRAQSIGGLDVANRRTEQKQLIGFNFDSSCTSRKSSNGQVLSAFTRGGLNPRPAILSRGEESRWITYKI